MSNQLHKLVDTPASHLWTDALHARALAHQTANKWNRDTYVRWTVTTAWTAFEMACTDAVEASKLGNKFKGNLDAAVEALSLPRLAWGHGLWQEVTKVYDLRKDYIHVGVSDEPIFHEVAEADHTISLLREAIKTIYLHARKPLPAWVENNDDPGWDKGYSSVSHGMVTHGGANASDPDAIKTSYIFKDHEYFIDVWTPGTDTSSIVDELINTIRIPISAIRVYEGDRLIEERKLRMRGA